jgi:L,D-peptidoglycan transpeptidase YkuD (ErfK/YbiS/YcfS/YnhG family)
MRAWSLKQRLPKALDTGKRLSVMRWKRAIDLRLELRSPAARKGRLTIGGMSFPCAIGRSGLSPRKREGDGATPCGRFGLMRVFYRSDRLRPPVTALPASPLRPHDGWCDAPGDRNYNRPVRLPYPAGHEKLWREDGLYDLIVVLNHNYERRTHGLGSAIFMHVAEKGLSPTAGCVALSRSDLLRLLRHCGPHSRLTTCRAVLRRRRCATISQRHSGGV